MVYDWTHITLIALIQGITEFLPISSSGHLVLLPQLTNLSDQGQLLDVAAHFGTLGAVIIYVWPEIKRMIIGFFSAGKKDKFGLMLVWMLVIASLPVIIIGLVIEWLNPAFLRLAMTVALANIIFAALLYRADQKGAEGKAIENLSLRDAFFIGLAQIFALIPGTSRSGVTMTMARYLGYQRLDAARFSMLMSIPVILGASLVKGRHFLDASVNAPLADALVIMAMSFVTAFAAIKLMMGWLAKADFKIFVYYRLALGGVLLAALALGFI